MTDPQVLATGLEACILFVVSCSAKTVQVAVVQAAGDCHVHVQAPLLVENIAATLKFAVDLNGWMTCWTWTRRNIKVWYVI